MAGLLAYEGSTMPSRVSQAAQDYLNYQKAIGNKLPLAVEGSGLPEGVRKAAQGALERGPRASAPAAPTGGWMDGQKVISGKDLGGLLSKGGGLLKGVASAGSKALGPVAAAYEGVQELDRKFGPTAYQNLANTMEEGRNRRAIEADPGLIERGQETAGRINQNAMEGVYGLMSQAQEQNQGAPQAAPQGLTAEELNAVNPNAPQAPQAAPQLPPEVQQELQQVQAAQQRRQTEAARQTLERGVTEGLKTGQTSVSELAKGVVQADAQRAGKQLTPEEEKKAVVAEVQTLKSMPPSDMSKYISYALVAGGLLAAAFDKSGKAGDAFSNSFNKQLDRNLAAGKMQLDYNVAVRKAGQEDRKINNTERDIDSKIEDRTGTRELKEKGLLNDTRRTAVAEGNLGVNQFKANTDARQGDARIGLMKSGQDVTMRGQDLNFQLGQDRITAANNRADAKIKAAGSTQKGVPMSYKDSKEIVNDVYKAQDLNIADSTKSQIAARLPTLQKAYPEMSASELVELAQGELDVERKSPMIYGNDTVRVRKPKE